MAHERTANVGAYGADAGDAPVAVKRVSWGAILAGLTIILVIQLLLSLLGVGIGASTIDPAQGQSPEVSSIGIGAGIWWVVTALISVLLGGWVAGRLSGMPTRLDGALHGLAAWGLSALVVFWLMTTAMSSLIGGAFAVVGSAVQTAGQAVVQGGQAVGNAANSNMQLPGKLGQIQNQIEQQITQMMNEGGQEAQQASQQIQQAANNPQVRSLVQKVVAAGPDGLSQADKEAAITAVVQNTSMSRQEVEQLLQQIQQAYQQAMKEAAQAAEVAANTVSQAAIWSFIALVVGAVVGAVGGAAGSPRDMRAPAYR